MIPPPPCDLPVCEGPRCRHYIPPVVGSVVHGVAACVLAVVEANREIGVSGMAREDVAQWFGISRQRVGQIEERALRKLAAYVATLGEVEA